MRILNHHFRSILVVGRPRRDLLAILISVAMRRDQAMRARVALRQACMMLLVLLACRDLNRLMRVMIGTANWICGYRSVFVLLTH